MAERESMNDGRTSRRKSRARFHVLPTGQNDLMAKDEPCERPGVKIIAVALFE